VFAFDFYQNGATILNSLGEKNMADCNHDCANCAEECDIRDPESLIIKPSEGTSIKRTIGIVSGKGGVGKSLVTSLIALHNVNKGHKVAILDADVTGPSIPKCFGLKGSLEGDGTYIHPLETTKGIKVVSANLLLEHETDPIIWRGPLINSLVKQFYTDVFYGQIDDLFIDMPPGTGDVFLTIMQSIKLDGLIIVTTPQDLVSMIVEKAIKTANMMNVKVLGIVENMSYVVCPKCDEKIEIFGKSKLEEIAKQYDLPILGRIPIDPKLAELCDKGHIEINEGKYFEDNI
jgi:Mrp family chromosome partitioning ATPase